MQLYCNFFLNTQAFPSYSQTTTIFDIHPTKKGGHPPWIPASKLYTAVMPPIAHSRYTQFCKLVFALAESIVKYEPIEQKDYWEEEGKFEGVKEHS